MAWPKQAQAAQFLQMFGKLMPLSANGEIGGVTVISTAMPTEIHLPNNWTPRGYQRKLWDYLRDDGKRAVCVWHRRAGKDEVMLHHTACAIFERPGSYWTMLPAYSQGRKAIWTAINPHTGKRRIDEAFPLALRKTTNEQEMFIRFKNEATWQVVGSDRYDAVVGSPRERIRK